MKTGTEVTKENAQNQDYTLVNVPPEGKKKWMSNFIVLLGFTFLSTTMAAGASVGVAFPFKELMVILLTGSAILSLYTAMICYVAAKTGLTTFVLARFALGKSGAKWADILLGGTQVIWYAVQTAYMGLLFTSGLGLEKYFVPITIFWGLIMGATAVKGTRGMEIIAYVALIPFIYLVYKVPALSVSHVGGFDGLLGMAASNPGMTFTAAVTIVIGTFISGGTNTPNWARFAKTPMQGFSAGFFSFMIGTIVMVLSGMLGGICFQSDDMIEVFIKGGIIVMAIVILLFNIWTTNTATAYAVGVACSEFFNKEKKEKFVIAGVIIGTLIAVLGVYDFFLPFLSYLAVFIPPMGGIIVGDFLCNWRKKFPKVVCVKFKMVRWGNWAAYLLASVIAMITNGTGLGIPSINGFIAAIVLVFVMDKIVTALKIDDRHEIMAGAEYVYGEEKEEKAC